MSSARTSATDLAKLFDDSQVPIYVLDEDRRIVFCNAACARWVGTRSDDLLGQQCAYHAAAEVSGPSRVAAGLCPPPKVFSGQTLCAMVQCLARDGTLVYRRGHFIPLSDGQDESAEVFAVLDAEDCSGDPQSLATTAESQFHDQLRSFRRLMAGKFQLDSLIGTSPAIVRARAQIELAASARANVLLLGPQGSGKDHAAKVLHYQQGGRGALVPLDCAALEANLLRSTIRSLALRHAASKESPGTLLLTDVDCSPIEIQAELAEVVRGESSRVAVVATATRPLGELVGKERFSRALACAVSTITIELPPLAQRLEDLPLLAQAFLEEENARGGKQVGGFTSEALDQLAGHAWPGNVDELAAIVRQSHERAGGGEVAARDLPDRIHWAADAAAHPRRADEAIVLEEFLAKVEKELITRAMRRAKGNKSKAAKLLGLTRPRLYRRLVQLGLEPSGEGDGA
jgi:DNA-binding NtrC family response regulator